MKQFRFLVALAAVVSLLAACGGGATVVNVKVVAQTTTIAINGRTQLSATITGSSNTAVTWETSDPSIATVDANGIVEANGVPGTVVITATSVADVTKSDSVTLTVGSFSITGVTISAPSTTLNVGGALQLSASVTPASAPQGVIWTSSNASVATISSSGKVTGVSAGTVVITARSAADIALQDQVTLTVGDGGAPGTVTSVTINDPNPNGPDQVQVAGTLHLTVTVVAGPGTSKAVTWSSSDNSVATVDNTGIVTGVTAGTVTITATSAVDTSASGTIIIGVIAGTVTDVEITNRPSGNALLVGVTRDLDATVSGTGTFIQDVVWTSSAPSVATIMPDGKVTGVAPGTTVIKAVAASDSNQDDSFTLTVSETSVDCSSPTALSDINAATTLPVGCYSTTPNQTVSLSAALTLQAGTIIQFGQSSRIDVNITGSLTANGSAGNPIIMRGQNPSLGFWDGISVSPMNAQNKLNYVQISEAGSDGYAGVYLQSTGSITISNTTISNSKVGLWAQSGSTISSFSSNSFSDNELVARISPSHMSSFDSASDYSTGNTKNYMQVRSGNSGSGTWQATDVPFRAEDNAVITVDGAVTMAPGAQVKFGQSARLTVSSSGTLNATGTSSKHISLSGATDVNGFWDGISVVSNAGNTFDYVDISNAGDDNYAGIYLPSTGGIAVSHTSFSKSTVGLWAESGSTISSFSSNSFSGNDLVARISPSHMSAWDSASDYSAGNTKNYMQVRSGNSGSGTWQATDVPFRAEDNAVITVDGAVTMAPGAQVKFGQSARLTVSSGGSLNATGTSSSHISLSGASASAGYWDGIDLASGSGNTFDYVDVADGGDDGFAGLYIRSGGSVTVNNSSFTNSATYGINLLGGGSITPNTVAGLTAAGNTFSGTSGPTNGIPAN